MKRKIAILLATVMTATALPTSVFAVNTKAPALEGSVPSGVAGKPIENPVKPSETGVANSTDVTNYKNALTKRAGVLKIELNKGLNGQTEIKKGDSFDIKLENAVFTVNKGIDPVELAYKNANYSHTDSIATEYLVQSGKLMKKENGTQSEVTLTDTSAKTLMDAIKPVIKTEGAVQTDADNTLAPLPHIPYSIEVKDDKTATVTFLSDISFKSINEKEVDIPSYYRLNPDKKDQVQGTATNQAYLAIPLGGAISVEGGEEVKVSINGYGSEIITDGTVTLAKVAGSGSTSINTSYIEKKVFEDRLEKPSDIIIQENVRDSFNTTETITVRLSSGFEFAPTNSLESDFKVESPTKPEASSIKAVDVKYANDGNDNTRIQFKLEGLDNSSDKESLRIKLPQIRPINEDKNYGEVSVSIYGGGITEESVVIAERQNLGFKLETKTEVPTITKGRYYSMNSILNTKGNDTAEFEISELVPNSLLSQRSVDFKVPEGVKIADVEVVSTNNLELNGKAGSKDQKDVDAAFDIVNDGTTLRLKRDMFRPNGNNVTAKLRLKLKLSVDAAFQGEEIKLTATGGGITEDLSAVIAKVENPFTIAAEPKNINIGYQNYSVNDITITETKPGMFMEGGNINLTIDAPYGTGEMGFTNAKVEVTSGNLEIKPGAGSKYYGNDAISINVKTQSTKEPASIKISNVEIGTTRSVPFGAYDLVIGGRAVINNDVIDSADRTSFQGEEQADLAASIKFDKEAVSAAEDLAKRIDAPSGSYKVAGYVNVVTAVDTIDKEMKVTIGSTTAVIEGKEVAMDAAPYIQANGSTMVPLRFVSVALSGGDASSVDAAQNSDKVSWDPNSKTVTIFYGAGLNQKIIQFKVGSSNMVVNNVTIPMENGAVTEIKNGRTFVPFRSLGQALGVSVDWDATTKTAIFNQK